MPWKKSKSKYGEATVVYQYVKLNKDKLPDYWHDKGTRVCIDGICCMLARGKYSDQEIAELYECRVPIIKQIRIAYDKTIRNLKKEHEEMVQTFGDLYTGTQPNTEDNLDFVEILCQILKR